MANMKDTIFHHVLLTKAKEDEFKRLNYVPSPEELSEVVQIRDNPQLLELFPWEMTKFLNQSDLSNYPGLELDRQFVHNHLFKHWNGVSITHAWVHQKGLMIRMRDIDTQTDHDVVFQKCFGVDKYFLQGGWLKNFAHRRGLLVGAQIGMYWDTRMKITCFSVLKETTPESLPESSRAAQNDTPGSSDERLIELSL